MNPDSHSVEQREESDRLPERGQQDCCRRTDVHRKIIAIKSGIKENRHSETESEYRSLYFYAD